MTPNENELSPLKSCPFCNDQALPSIRATGYCPNCGACGPEHGEHWNDRPRESELEQALVLAREALETSIGHIHDEYCCSYAVGPTDPVKSKMNEALTAIKAELGKEGGA